MNKYYFIFLTLLSLNNNLIAQQLISSKKSSKGTGGNNDICNICHTQTGIYHAVELKLLPSHFPFIIDKVIFEDPEIQKMSLDFVGSNQGTNLEIVKYINGVPSYYPIQTIYSNSFLLDQDGMLTIHAGYKAKYCLESNWVYTGSNFNVDVTVSIEKLNYGPNGFESLGYYKSNSILHNTDLLYNCDGSFPYRFSLIPSLQKRGISKNLEEDVFEIYPNPCDNNLNFKIKDSSIHLGIVEIYSIQGKLAFKKDFRLLKSDSNSLDLSQLEKGIYFFRFHSSKRSFCRTFIVR